MYTTKKIAVRRDAFTLIEMMVVIAIILALAALAAAFAPRVNENQKMTRAVDNLEQWLLTAKMRAKRDGLATGIRFIPDPNDLDPTNLRTSLSKTYSQFQYIQQPEPLIGGVCLGGPPNPPQPPPGTYQYPLPAQLPPLGGNYYIGGIIKSAGITPPDTPPQTAAPGLVFLAGVDFSLGGLPQFDAYGRQQWLVQTGDYLEINGGGVFLIAAAKDFQTLQLSPSSTYASTLNIAGVSPNPPTTNYRILRQPRLLLGEEPLTLPTNYAVNFNNIPGTGYGGCNVNLGFSGYYEIIFSPTGAVVGNNSGTSTIVMSIWDTTAQVFDPNLVGVVGVQSRSGFIGAYGLSAGANPYFFVQTARVSGL